MNVVQAIAPMMKYRPRAATMATYSQSGRPLGRRCSCICLTPVGPWAPVRLLCSECRACDGSADCVGMLQVAVERLVVGGGPGRGPDRLAGAEWDGGRGQPGGGGGEQRGADRGGAADLHRPQ